MGKAVIQWRLTRGQTQTVDDQTGMELRVPRNDTLLGSPRPSLVSINTDRSERAPPIAEADCDTLLMQARHERDGGFAPLFPQGFPLVFLLFIAFRT